MANDEKWVELFRKMGINPREIEILQTIDLGYLSDVYLISVDGKEYAVKMYHERYLGTNICMQERQHMMRARKSIPTAVPRTIFCSTHTENAFNREILVMKRALGIPLTNKGFNDDVFNALVAILKQLHSTQVNANSTPTHIARIDGCRRPMIRFLNEQEIIPKQRLLNHLSASG